MFRLSYFVLLISLLLIIFWYSTAPPLKLCKNYPFEVEHKTYDERKQVK